MDVEYTKDNPLRCFFAFEGYNSQGLALNRLKQHVPDFDWVCVGRSEIDKYAIQAADALFPEAKDKNFGDISKIDWNEVPDFDLFTMSSPCQDFSQAGLQKGGAEGSGTRSSLLWECRRAILSKKPKYIVFENVKALVSQKFLPYFIKWQNELASYGYSNFAKVLNSSSYGIPQNRERIFMVSILDDNASYHFPEPFPLDKRLKDVLEQEVDEKYYLSKKVIDTFIERNKINEDKGNGFKFEPTDGDCVASSVLTMPGSRPCDNYIKEPIACAMRGREVQCLTPKRTEYGKKVRKEYESGDLKESRHNMQQLEPRTDGVCNTITSVQKDNLIIEPRIYQVGNIYQCKGFSNPQIGRIYSPEGISPTIDTAMGGNREIKILSYTRDDNGKVVDRHFKDVANTVHGGTGKEGNTDSFVFEPKIIEVAKKVEEMVNKSRSVKCGVSISKDNRIVAFQYDKKRSSVSEYRIDNDEGISQTVISANEPKVYGETTEYRIRKLTPREVLRLMDVDDSDIDKIFYAGISNTQIYKMGGNSIVVSCLYHIFRKLFIYTENENKQLTLF